ncbi:hypothetical protein [Blastochloris viridis]|uniref:Uncharacterized protein n=1 Tax=Blastochloris viridis TaxID=1079 RepID=A0A0H5BD17_BLAVI|nr:hypothetical protein [Blastochloris viridis]ALK11008.1 hypothetical protein BVIR_3252 [Blastochloris viridis]BAR99004.1 hypothetical protein BV133_1411 [Blastochloris viridis]CUU43670.1 hypothetical protein BVIRIDIS_26960 [Blastochloris viridis]
MCDYSLHHVTSRPAKVGETLVSRKFENSVTRGFAAPAEPEVAVCLLPGTELRFETDVECVSSFWLMPRRKIHARLARFRQLETDSVYAHRDALEFPDGRIVLLTTLRPGQKVTVLQLPAGAKAGAHHHPAPAEQPRAKSSAPGRLAT